MTASPCPNALASKTGVSALMAAPVASARSRRPPRTRWRGRAAHPSAITRAQAARSPTRSGGAPRRDDRNFSNSLLFSLFSGKSHQRSSSAPAQHRRRKRSAIQSHLLFWRNKPNGKVMCNAARIDALPQSERAELQNELRPKSSVRSMAQIISRRRATGGRVPARPFVAGEARVVRPRSGVTRPRPCPSAAPRRCSRPSTAW